MMRVQILFKKYAEYRHSPIYKRIDRNGSINETDFIREHQPQLSVRVKLQVVYPTRLQRVNRVFNCLKLSL